MPRKKAVQRRRAKGTGSIRHDKKRRRWVGRLPVGRTPQGNTRYREVCGTSREEVVRKLATLQPPKASTTLREWSVRWFAGLTVRPGTTDSYNFNFDKHILPTLGHIRVADLSPTHIEAASRTWTATPRKRKTPLVPPPTPQLLDPNTVRLALLHLSICLKEAVRAGLITTNPLATTKRPRKARKTLDPYTPNELTKIISEATKRDTCRPVALIAATGIRRGECIALNVEDFDPLTNTISITKTDSGKRGPGPPKTERSIRVVPVPDDALPAILAAKGERTTGPLFLSRGNRRESKELYRRQLKNICRRLGIRYRSLHQLRHAVASAGLATGAPLGDMADHMGHSVEVLVKTYVHPVKADMRSILNRVLNGNKVSATPTNPTKTSESP